MNVDRWRETEDLFHEALKQPAAARAGFVASTAAGRDGLADEVMALLDAHDSTHTLLDAPRISALPSGMRLGPYALDRLLGTGGMATVYLAHRADQQFEKHVAVKLVNQGLAAELSGDRFLNERQILARLEHPNIARLLDAGVSDFGQPFIVMEWVDGVPLDTWREQTRPPVETALTLWLQIAEAVAYAHRNLVVHRDLKPSNVLVSRDGQVKLVDFGVAKLLGDATDQAATTRTRHFTPQYASPEQLQGLAVTTSTDIYGLGLLLHELVVGAPPYGDATRPSHEYAQAILEEDVRMPRTVPADLAAIIRMSLRKDPERRYVSADQFAEDVRRFRRGRPVTAQPETWTYHFRTFLSRHRVPVATAALGVISLIVLTIIALVQARIANEQRARAEQVTSFVTGFLGATPTGPDPVLQNKGVSLRVVELADVIAQRLGSNDTLQPEAEQTLRAVLAMTYYQMGEIQKAHENAVRAIELCDRLYGPEDPRRFSVEIVQAAVENSLGKFADAEARASRIMATWHDPSPLDQANVALQLGGAQLRLGKADVAERTMREGVARAVAELGADHPSLGLAASYLGLVYLERGEFDRAVIELDRSAAISRRSVKDASMPLAWVLVNLANAYRFLGRTDDVLRAAEESYAQFKGALGEGHYSTVHPLAFIAYAKAIRGDDDAETFARRAVAVQASLPPDNYERAVGLTFLGFVLMQKHELAEARTTLQQALELRRHAFKAPNWRIAETAGWLGEVLAQQGDRASARPLLEESLATFTTLYGAQNPRTLDARARLARSLD